MTEHNTPNLDAVELRRRAQERLDETPEADLLTEESSLRLMHELQVHQIELEMQNQ